MEKDYVPRRTSSAPARRRPPARGGRNNRRKSTPPPIIPIAILLVLVVVVVVLIVVFTGGKKDPASSSQTSSQTSSALSSQASSSGVSEVSSTASSELSMPEQKKPDKEPEKLTTMVQVGDTGYEYYNFVEDTANDYITMVSKAGEELKGSATLYDMVIPTSMDIMLPESYIEEHGINSQDQRKAIEDYIYPSINAMNPDVKTVSIFDALRLHSNEYIYFRTDHHWTQLGAYYAYEQFCKVKGFEPTPLSQFDKKSYEGFLGSFYSDSQSDAMASNPDTVEADVPKANATLSAQQQQGDDLVDWPVIQDGSDYSSENLYLIFIAGDQPYEEITNQDLTDGSSCVVVKESFGNAFVPYLVNHYQTIYVVDYRYYDGNIADLAKEKGAKDVIMLNNISMTRNADLVESISGKF